ncbi:EGF domain-specific O-linked N-acetylglucosamine transferase [Gracilariopsis chorda]|uniref:EGF domain-specific O-linked N-acetylglucosamine transferase n=1 Tax=Gracilariopsis chorda TaxID=448386 RepID=A0A2V3IEG0_9FLOR|nr:EGF domain-specific O-linked N-acetylglucosamine transferase [Gracilariopsis chorda]|eukprot:PXF40475.1 EGF domain-specific O-linked N-acetylglucosamine transferase [Gracilariopsis chorda]
MRFNTTFEIDGTHALDHRPWNRPEATKPSSNAFISHIDNSEEQLVVEKAENMFRETRRPSTFAKQEGAAAFRVPLKARMPCADKFLELPRPILSTYPRRRPNSLMRRVLGLFMALSVAIGLLGCMMDRLSTELDTIESELRRRNDIMAAKERFEETSLHTPSTLGPERSSRRLAAAGIEPQIGDSHGLKQESGLWGNIKLRLWTLHKVVSILSDGTHFEISAALFKTISRVAETTLFPSMPGNNTVGRAPHPEHGTNGSPKTLFLAKAQLHDYTNANRTLFTSAGKQQGTQHDTVTETSNPMRISTHAWTGSTFSRTVSGTPTSYNLHRPAINTVNLKTPTQDAVLASLNQPSPLPRIGPNHFSTSNIDQSYPFPISVNAHKERRQNVIRSSQFADVQIASAGSLIVWELPMGRSLCRLFNVGRLRNGTLVLPTWMKKHREALAVHCGIREVFFVLDIHAKEHDKWVHGLSNVQLDDTYADRDLFSLQTPRHHMPHFLSDIIAPLVASEVLLGSGRESIPFKIISAEMPTTTNHPQIPLYDTRPILFLNIETAVEPPTNWVPSLARFFEHKRVGFELAVDELPLSKDAVGNLDRLRLFRSVMSTNINPYEPYGLFDADGKNYVFQVNGISRKPTWMTEGICKQHCKTSVTVLTREGHRALLEVDKLENKIKSRFMDHGLETEVKIVDFRDTSFDEQVKIMQETNVLIASHGAGNTNLVFMRPGGAVIEIFPFSYKAGPFDGFAKIFGMEYKTAMSAPQTEVFKTCMHRNEKNKKILQEVFEKWDRAVEQEKVSPWIHRLEFEKEFGKPGKSEGMQTRICVRQQQLKFNIDAVAQMALESAVGQINLSKMYSQQSRS